MTIPKNRHENGQDHHERFQYDHWSHTAQKMKFSIKDFFSKYDQIRRKLWIWSHLLNKSLMENFIFCAVLPPTIILTSFGTLITIHYENIKHTFIWLTVPRLWAQWRIQAVRETHIPVRATKLWRAKNTFQVFFFSCISAKNTVK